MTGWILRLNSYDERLLHALILRRRVALDGLARGITRLGDAAVAIGLAGFLLVGVIPGLEKAGAQATFTLVMSHLMVQLVKRTISRPRPRVPVGMYSLAKVPDRFSFPSGHSAAALSVALPLFLALPLWIGILFLLVAVAVGLSRCYLGVHYPGDVLAGWGLAVGAFTFEQLFLGLPGLF